jgi:hypothetical protein
MIEISQILDLFSNCYKVGLNLNRKIMKTSLKIFSACALGALICVAVAREFSQTLWWIGLIPGALGGYLSYEFKTVLKAIPKAFKAAVNWKPNKKLWFKRFEQNLQISITFSSFGWLVCLGSIIQKGGFDVIGSAFLEASLLGFVIFVGFFLGGIPMSALFTRIFINKKGKEFIDDVALEDIDFKLKGNSRKLILFGNFVVLPFSLSFYVLKGLWFFRKEIAKGVRAGLKFLFVDMWVAIGKFIKIFFLLIHSDARIICAIDSAIGGAIGVYFGYSMLVGVIAGGLLGLLNYWVISIKLLRIQPKHA